MEETNNMEDRMSDPATLAMLAPQDGPHKIPAKSPRRSRRSRTPPAKSSSPSALPGDLRDKRLSCDYTDETISILDPRRFTPTLHANLVSEILALRRDQEDKEKLIGSLEEDLHSAQSEQESLRSQLTGTAKESRSLKRQLALLEGGTSSALGELAREREEAVENVTETRKRLEEAQKKIRAQQAESDRVHDSWAQEKADWENEKRNLAHKVHIAESRLKAVLSEVVAFQAARPSSREGHHQLGFVSDGDESVRDNDAGSIRSLGRSNSLRFSTMSGVGSLALNGATLADELAFSDGEDEEEDLTVMDDQESVYSKPSEFSGHVRSFSRESGPAKARGRKHSLESLKIAALASHREHLQQTLHEVPDEHIEPGPEPVKVSYTDAAIQYSPPPSPITHDDRPNTPESTPQRVSRPRNPSDDDKCENDARERVRSSDSGGFSVPPLRPMVSSASQTISEPLSPPKTPELAPAEIKVSSTASAGTQTEQVPPSPTRTAPPPPSSEPLSVPSINIEPPTSRPSTPREPRLPQHFKHFGCQVSLSTDVQTKEAETQTEGIKVDQRLALLPVHLQPSSITSRPNSPSASGAEAAFTPAPRKARSRKSTESQPQKAASSDKGVASAGGAAYDDEGDDDFEDAYPGANDDGPLSGHKYAPARRPHRFSSLFAGFDTASSEAEDFDDGDLSDSQYRTALSAPRPQSLTSKSRKGSAQGASSSPEDTKTRKGSSGMVKSGDSESQSSYTVIGQDDDASRALKSSTGPASLTREMRKSALIQSGIASHNRRRRSPSLPESGDPPFPIPARASSRQPTSRISMSSSSGRRSPTKGLKGHRNSYRTNNIRKVRSAAALPPSQRDRRQGSRSPPPSSYAEVSRGPGLPPMPRNEITGTRSREAAGGHFRGHRQQLSSNTTNTHTTEPVSIGSTSQTTGVVDAISQTMIGEWMWKYVRRRKSFGVPENNNSTNDNSNDRHKRWVWLAPYERAILWSSKQPSSGSALMGKTGRKLSIQSVLDVKDDNPAPKGAATVFNRSILILTPQRALKFTAPNAERHYVWLTALSFLAHSQQAVPDLPVPATHQAKKPPLPEFEAAQPKVRRPGIRDSIRLAKGKPGQAKSVVSTVPTVPSIPSAPGSRAGEAPSQPLPDSIGMISSSQVREDVQEAAEAPYIPRFTDRIYASSSSHGRKRSNTGGFVPPPLSFKGFGFGHNASNSLAGASDVTAMSSEGRPSQGSATNANWALSQSTSRRTSEASSPPVNFFDAIGTVRMEAFISPLGPGVTHPEGRDEVQSILRQRSKEGRRRNSRSRRGSRDSYGMRRPKHSEEYAIAAEMEALRGDPFKTF